MKIHGIKNYRQAKKIPQSVVAELLNISRYYYIKMEQSEIIPDKYIPLLSDILGYDFSLMTPFSPPYLQALRNISGISQKDFGDVFGVSQQTVMKQENGDNAFGYQKYKDTFFAFFKEQLEKGDIFPFVVKQVPGAMILFYLDQCYILIDDEQLFNFDAHFIDPDVEISIYKLNPII